MVASLLLDLVFLNKRNYKQTMRRHHSQDNICLVNESRRRNSPKTRHFDLISELPYDHGSTRARSNRHTLWSLEDDRVGAEQSDEEEEITQQEQNLQKLISKCSASESDVRCYTGQNIEQNIAEYASLCRGDKDVEPQILGKGGFSTVYRININDSQYVAIKRLSPQRQSVKKDYLRFMHEILALHSIKDIEGCVHILGFCTEQPYCCIIMEYIPRGSMYNTLHRKEENLPWARRMQIALDMVSTMRDLHARDLLHRDFKMNVLLEEDFSVKLCDFSYLKECSRIKKMVPHGTPFWMAPEVLRGELYDKKSDIFSLGIVLWELLTRHRPYEEYDAFQVIQRVGRMREYAKKDILRMPIPRTVEALLELDQTLTIDEVDERQFQDLCDLISQCWLEDWQKRPSIDQIYSQLQHQKAKP